MVAKGNTDYIKMPLRTFPHEKNHGGPHTESTNLLQRPYLEVSLLLSGPQSVFLFALLCDSSC